MATNSLQSLHHNHHSLFKLHHDSAVPSPIFLKPITTTTTINPSLSISISTSNNATTTFSISPTASTASTTSQTFSLETLEEHLSAQNFRQADEVTRKLLIILAGEAAQKRGYVFFSEVKFISEDDLKAIDNLWKKYTNNKFGYSVQKKIWQSKIDKDFTKFFIKVGWMKKLDTEIEQYNYKSFPNEFIWELNDETPEGHLPLTNALRGTQLLTSIFTHPAFDADNEEDEDSEGKLVDEGNGNGGLKGLIKDSSKPLSKNVFKPNYSF